MKKYVVELTSEERMQLEGLIKKGKVAGYKIRHAQMLLKADQGKQGPGWHDKQIAEAFGAHLTTVERLRKRLVEQGLQAALERNKRQNYTRKLDGDAEARLIAIACAFRLMLMGSLWLVWKTCLMYTKGHMIQSFQRYVSMRLTGN